MKFTPHQVRAILDIKEQTLRYWKQAYPQLINLRGYGPCYSFGEVLVLLVTKKLVEKLGVDIKNMQPLAGVLFPMCSAPVSLLRDTNKVICIDVESMTVKLLNIGETHTTSIALIVSLHELAQELQNRILSCLGDDESLQLELTLGPTALVKSKEQKKA